MSNLFFYFFSVDKNKGDKMKEENLKEIEKLFLKCVDINKNMKLNKIEKFKGVKIK